MNDQLRSLATTEYTMLVFDFADLEGCNKADIEKRMKCALLDLFDKQKNADRAKRSLKSDFDKALALYFNAFQTHAGFDYEALRKKLDASPSVFSRHLGKHMVCYLRLLISIARIANENRKGLLVA